MGAEAPLRVLVIDDDADTRANLSDILALDGIRVETADTAAAALARADWDEIAAILLDRRLPDSSAEELLPRLRARAPHASVLIVTGHADLHGAIAALRLGAADYILKPINPETLRTSLRHIAERRRLTCAKERSEAAFRTLVETAPCLVVIVRPTHHIVYFNPFAEELTGYRAEQVLGKEFPATFLPPEAWQAFDDLGRRSRAAGGTRGFEGQILCRDGSRRFTIWNAAALPQFADAPALLCIGQDITALKRAQERTLQTERLAAIGQMMTGLTHESGNALARSQACLEMLALEVQDRAAALDLVARIQKAQDHLQQLYEEVRSYAAPVRLERAPAALDAVWRQAWANLAMRRAGRDAVLHAEAAGVELRCAVDSFRLEQVFRIIMENSLAACRDPVEIAICATAALLEGRPAVRVSLRDNGPGLNAEQRQRLFEPFFTTKTKGTGLGMAIAVRVIEAHAGQIAVGASTGLGAEIVITLPRDEPP